MHWLRFNVVGAVGMAVHLGSLAFLTEVWGVPYLLATMLAVEAAVLHNFAWHCRWTWRDRPAGSSELAARLLRFHAANGIVSIVGNLILMRLLVGALGLPPTAAGVLSIIPTSIVNFLISDRWVFGAWPQCSSPVLSSRCER